MPPEVVYKETFKEMQAQSSEYNNMQLGKVENVQSCEFVRFFLYADKSL